VLLLLLLLPPQRWHVVHTTRRTFSDVCNRTSSRCAVMLRGVTQCRPSMLSASNLQQQTAAAVATAVVVWAGEHQRPNGTAAATALVK
jgi:hypothetical protein